jgi:restriction endonuclease S subunit
VAEKNLKPGWRKVKFGEVVRQCKEKTDPETSGLERYVAGDHMDTDDLRLRRWGEIGSGYLGPAFHMRFKPGQVLYGSRRTYLRKVAVADFDGICANTTFVLEPKDPDELLPEFLPFLMQTDAFNNFSVKNSKGSVNPYINFSDLARFEFVLPPISEQTRIVELLTAFEDGLRALEHCKQSCVDLYHRLVEDNYSIDASESKSTTTLSDIAYINPAQLTARECQEDRSIRYIDISTVLNPKIIGDIATVHLSEASSRARRKVRDGDLIVSTVRPNLKSFARINKDLSDCIVSTGFAVLRAKSNCDPSFIFHGLFSKRFELFCTAKNEGTSYPAIKPADLEQFIYPKISLEEQQSLGQKLDELEKAEFSLEARYLALKTHAGAWRNKLVEAQYVV